MHYRLANGRDMDALIDFIDMVFSMVRVPHDFEAILPKVYGPGRRRPEIHVIAEDDEGRLCGCLGMMTYPLRVAGRTLRVGYLGSMAVHPRARGQGVMGELLRRQIARAQRGGFPDNPRKLRASHGDGGTRRGAGGLPLRFRGWAGGR